MLALPYGDLDVSAAARQPTTSTPSGESDLLGLAQEASTQVLDGLSISSTPVVAPPSGRLSAGAAESLDPGTAVVLAPDAVPGRRSSAVLDRSTGGRLLVSTRGRDLWGPRPGSPRTALSVRQRILADAALHALSPQAAEPLVRILPVGWDPGARWSRARFFGTLAQPWLTQVDLAGVMAGPSTDEPVAPADLAYPGPELDAELGPVVLSASRGLVHAGSTLAAMLTDNDTIDEALARQALLGSSVWSRLRPGLAVTRVRGSAALVDGWLAGVTVRSASFVRMSDDTGLFSVTLINDLDEPVTVGLRATASGGRLTLVTPEAREIPAHSRTAVRVDATATDIGIHLVTLQPVTADGEAVGQPSTLSIRSSKVGLILWIVMGVGGAVLFVVVVFRVWRRVQQRRATHGPRLRAAQP